MSESNLPLLSDKTLPLELASTPTIATLFKHGFRNDIQASV